MAWQKLPTTNLLRVKKICVAKFACVKNLHGKNCSRKEFARKPAIIGLEPIISCKKLSIYTCCYLCTARVFLVNKNFAQKKKPPRAKQTKARSGHKEKKMKKMYMGRIAYETFNFTLKN